MRHSEPFNGKLKEEGWGEIGSLMIDRKPHPIVLIALDTPKVEAVQAAKTGTPFRDTMRAYRLKAKSLWLPPEREAYLLRKNRRKGRGEKPDKSYPQLDLP